MDFSFPKERHFYMSTNYEKSKSAKIIEVFIYNDANGSILCLKKNEFIGVFDSFEDLESNMKDLGFKNLNSFSEFKGQYIVIFARSFVKYNKDLNKIILEQVDSNFKAPVFYNENYLINKVYKKRLAKVKEEYAEFRLQFKNYHSPLDPEKFLEIDISKWDEKEKKMLFSNISKGISYYYSEFSNKKHFDIKTYESLIYAIEGCLVVEVYNESIKWFDKDLKKKLERENYEFPDKERYRKYTYEPREKFNDTYYNDQLDMDQQGPEFWDSL